MDNENVNALNMSETQTDTKQSKGNVIKSIISLTISILSLIVTCFASFLLITTIMSGEELAEALLLMTFGLPMIGIATIFSVVTIIANTVMLFAGRKTKCVITGEIISIISVLINIALIVTLVIKY